jgi:hypothetical protein
LNLQLNVLKNSLSIFDFTSTHKKNNEDGCYIQK